MDPLFTFLVGLGGVLIGLVAEHSWIYFREKGKENRQKQIIFPNDERILPESVFHQLSPGSSIDLMKAALGTPNKTYKDYEPVYAEINYDENGDPYEVGYDESRFTNAYTYNFKNAYLKVTSKDRETIDSLAVEVKEGDLSTGHLPLGWGDGEGPEPICILGLSKVNQELAEICTPAYWQSRYESVFVLRLYTAAPLYTYYTYFGSPDFENGLEPSKDDANSFIGSTITGVCLHSTETDCYIIGYGDHVDR